MMNQKGERWGLLLLLAAVMVVVVIAVVVAGPDREVDPEGDPATDQPVPAAAAGEIQDRVEEMRAAVRRYERHCAAGLEAEAGPGLRAIITDCIDRLASSMDAIVAADTVGQIAIEEHLDRYRSGLRNLQATRPGDESAEATRRVLMSMAELLEVVREERFTESLSGATALEEARAAAGAIEPDRPLATQRHRVQRFFLAAGEVLGGMARPGA